MRLKRLICRGFKSFADKTEFEFDSTLTGIVGPNGCGKSNVVDALKWVLGDQRARSLRGKEMTDVIFKGAEGREGMPAAEVQIVLEDEAGLLDGRTEVTVGRRLTREKESDYLLNGDSVRLKDVRDAMMDTGLGVGAYSVMEQGRIDAVLSADPESRRAIFEEAAGISRFKQQKRESLRRLDRTEQNLARVIDLLEERGKRIRSLKIQASRARRYAELRDELRDWKAALAVSQAIDVRRAEEEQHGALEQRQADLVEAEEAHREALQRLEEIEGSIRTMAAAIKEVEERQHQVRGRQDAARNRAETLRERSAEQLADAEGAAARRVQLSDQCAERMASLEEERRRLTQLESEQEVLEEQLVGRQEAVAARQRALDDLEREREATRDRVLEWIHRRTQVRNLAHSEEAQIKALTAREARIDERRGSLREELEQLAAQRAEQERIGADLERRTAALRTEERDVHADLEVADREAAEFARRESALREQLSSVAGRKQILADMERHMEGLDRGPRHLLQEQPAGLRGRLLDLLEVGLEHGAALEAALGPLVQALVVDTRANADAMLAALAAGQHGRALLLVEEEFSEEFDRGSVADVPPGAQPLANVVHCAEHARPLLNWLLRGVCLVQSLADARPNRHDLCFVTRDGDLLCGPRVEGGVAESQGGLVVRKAQMMHLSQEEGDLQSRLEDLLHNKQAVAGRVEGLRNSAQRLAAEAQRLRAEELAAEGELRRVDARRQDLERESETVELESRELHQQSMSARAALGAHLLDEHLLARLERREAEAEEGVAVALGDAQDELTRAREAEQELRLRQVACATDREGLQATIRVHEQGLADLRRTDEDLAARETAARAGAERARGEAEVCQEEVGTHQAQLDELNADLAQRAEALADVEERRDGERARLTELEEQRSAIGEAITGARLELSELEHKFARVDDRLREETTVELRRCLGEITGFGLVARELPGPPAPEGVVAVLEGPPLPPEVVQAQLELNRLWEQDGFDQGEARRQAEVLQSKVDRLGHVNLDAVRELDEMESSYEFLQQEVADLKDSRRSLMETLRRLETESRALFETTFEEARKNFQSIFRKLFQGGKADMYLTEGEDALEAGIEIIAKPPGKELQSINLLSGGERSLTALAILFAVFKVKPSPFCVLDEVDAALDDTNVERFLRVLRDFVGPTQFCIVTHHKRTMAECQKLYGITMQRRGVSSRIAVSLDEVEQVTSTSNGTGPGELRREQITEEVERVAGQE